MKIRYRLAALSLVLFFSSNSQAVVIYDQAFDTNNNIFGGWILNTQADDFFISSNSTFDSLTLWASYYYGGQIISPNFTFDIGTTLGGDDIFNSSVLVANNLIDTGIDHNDNGNSDIYQMVFDLGQNIDLFSNTTYYLTVNSIQEAGEDKFVWQRSSSTGTVWVGQNLSEASGAFSFQLNQTVSVPEPTSIGLMGLGLAAIGFFGRKAR